ncbi:TTL-domain-containing protein [Panus rudis PR-1116 ss-1]|nr:TTL-domain-containing protein [Panus rudis PR-1116 ss-1]
MSFTAAVSWPSAPLTDSLVKDALNSLSDPPDIVLPLPEVDAGSEVQKLLQWSTYDAINHDLTYTNPSRVLSSSYVIRKALIRKHYLSRCIQTRLTKHPESALSNGTPKTWDVELSFADELDELFNDELWDLRDCLDREHEWFILKPGMADRGMGIRLFNTKEQLRQIFESFEEGDSEEEEEDAEVSGTTPDTFVALSQLRHFVIQEYLPDPLLIDPEEALLNLAPCVEVSSHSRHGHKFHLRAYCIASGALSLYLYTRILALFSAVPYTPPDADVLHEAGVANLAAHLTNTSLQSERGEAGVRLLNELIGCHVLSSASKLEPKRGKMMSQAMDTEQQATAAEPTFSPSYSHDSLSVADVEDIQEQMAEILAETFKAALDMSVHFQPLPNAFELFGIDFLVTHHPNPTTSRKYQVSLLEINSEPAIELTGPRLTWILKDLFKIIAHTFVEPFFRPADDKRSGWSVGETRENLKKCLDVEVRGAGGW